MKQIMHVRLIRANGLSRLNNTGLLAYYVQTGDYAGIYSTDLTGLRDVIRQFKSSATEKDIREVLSYLRDTSEVVEQCTNSDYIPVANGVYDFRNKKLLPFEPDLVFLSKSHTNYNPNAVKPDLFLNDGTPWDADRLFADIMDDPEMEDLLWHIVGAALRQISWGKMIVLYSSVGCNGKGTLCLLVRCLLGQGNTASLPLHKMSEKFALSSLVNVSCICTDENPVGKYLDENDVWKAVVTGDVVSYEKKYGDPTDFTFHGLVIECFNDLPKIKDKSESALRRLLMVPFDKSFIGHEKPEIKNDLMQRPETLEYYLKKLLEMDYFDKLPEPPKCRDMLDAYQVSNDPVRAFLNEFLAEPDALKWSLVPYDFLYSLLKAYLKKNYPSAKLPSNMQFYGEVKQLVDTGVYPLWYRELDANGKDKRIRPGNHMSLPEPLIREYELKEWMQYTTHNGYSYISDETRPNLKETYRGLQRA